MDDNITPRHDAGSLGLVVTGANVLVTVVLVGAMYSDSHSATVAVLAGVGYFALTTGLTVLALSGTLTAVVTNRQRELTIRQRDRMAYHLAAQQAMPHAAPLLSIDQSAAQPLMLTGDTYVPAHAHETTVRIQALAWLRPLYLANGAFAPSMVVSSSDTAKAGWVKAKWPSREVIDYLRRRGVLRDHGHALQLRVVDEWTTDSTAMTLMTEMRDDYQARIDALEAQAVADAWQLADTERSYIAATEQVAELEAEVQRLNMRIDELSEAILKMDAQIATGDST